MKSSRISWVSRVVMALLCAASCISSTPAQRNPSGMPQPRLYQVNPPGAKAGSTLEVVIAGFHLEEPERLVFGDPGIKAEFLPPPAPEIDPKTKKPKPVANALPADHFKFRVTVPPTAKLGNHYVRVVSKWGVSNPRVFVVGDLPEMAEKEPNNEVDQANKVELNTTINGTLGSPTDVDYFAVAVKKGQRVVVSCQSGSIDGRALPQIEIYDAKDRQLASNCSYSGTDAVADFIASEDGTYTVRLIQFTHIFRAAVSGGLPGGASDHFYRLSISTRPWIDSVHPAVVEAGKTTMVTVLGRNLPGGQIEPTATVDESTLEKITMPITVPPEARGKLNFSGYVPPNMGWEDGLELRVKNASGSSNPFLVGLARVPLLTDNDKNDTPELAQEIPL
ncbi:MAG: PPC domain-containing protein, partial [Gemmataceae bacterium]